MRLLNILPFFQLASATILVKYDAAAGDDPKVLGLLNLEGWERADWPSGKGMNSSVYFETEKDPAGVAAAHVHKDAHFTRAEYHALKGKTTKNAVYYIGYKVRFAAIEAGTIVFQWKNYDGQTVPTDNIPAALVFRKDPNGDKAHTIHFGVQPDPTKKGADTIWTKTLNMGKTYRFGIVVDTHEKGFVQLYFNGDLATFIHPTTGEHVQKLPGNYWPGPIESSDPKVGLYGANTNNACDSYIYNVVIGTALSDIATVAGISI
ncbi:unnamed protein product [Clonostachys rosea f. rosea IK726]|uniref:Uncharacterized protein n=1 Tax=Clonostachys rosea f. rosea IK726 TaxID=1349383 RepID=A0ACA9UBL1_BIOOC|nr:unnamed protein product [Clonostachys rosea f. rosea IK726]